MSSVYYPRAVVVLSVLLDGFGADDELVTFQVRPRSVQWRSNDHRQADTFTVELDYNDFPIDPRAVRSVLVAVHCGDAGPSGRFRVDGRERLRFLGYVDEPASSLSAAGETVSMAGRDYTGLYLDATFSTPTGTIDIARPLRAVLGDLLAMAPGGADLAIVDRAGVSGTLLSEVTGKRWWAPRAKADDVWTVIVDLVGLLGVVATVRLDELVIETADQVGETTVPMLYGENTSSLSFKRKLNEAATRQIEVRCWNPAERRSLTAVYPPTPIVVRKKITPAGKVTVETAPRIAWNVTGGYTQSQLEHVAERVYRAEAREQVEGVVETSEMLGGFDSEAPVDLTTLRNGDRLFVILGKDNDRLSVYGLSEEEAVRWLAGPPQRLEPETARAVVRAWHAAESLASVFYAKTVVHSWSRTDGYKASVSFVNLVGGL